MGVEFWPRSHQDGLSDSASGGWKAVERGQSGQSEQRVASNSGHTTQSQGQQLECRVSYSWPHPPPPINTSCSSMASLLAAFARISHPQRTISHPQRRLQTAATLSCAQGL